MLTDKPASYSYIQDPALLHDVWDDCNHAIAKCMETDNSQVWLKDVYSSIRSGRSLLLICRWRATDKYAGMGVLVEHIDPYDGKTKTLHIWYANTEEECVTEEALGTVEELARSRGCNMVTLRGSSPSFARWGPKRGFNFAHVELYKQV